MTTPPPFFALQEKNLIQRQEHETDTRAKIVELTNELNFFSQLGNKTNDFNNKLLVLLNQRSK